MPPHPLQPFLQYFFRQLYHGFAWSYDLVAAAVSVGRWEAWIQTSTGFLQGPRVLEIGFGTGMLQRSLLADGRWIVAGVDESAQMARLARRRLVRAGLPAQNLVRGVAQRLPYASGVLDSVVSTFPSEFVVQADSLRGDAARAPTWRKADPGAGCLDRWDGGSWIAARPGCLQATHQAPGIQPDQVASTI